MIATGSTLRIRLWLLVAAALLPLAALASAGLIALAREQQAQLERGLVERARAIASAVDVELQSSIAALKVLALSRALERGELRAFHAETQLAAKARADWEGIIVLDAAGRRVLNSRVPFGEPIPGGDPAVEPASVAALLATGQPSVGALAKGPGGRWRFPVRVPVYRDGVLTFILTAFARPEGMTQVIDRQKVPPQSVSTVFDGRLSIVARSRNHDDHLGSVLSDSLRELMADAQEGTGITVTRDGQEVYTAFSRTAAGGWGVAVGVPRAALDAPIRRWYFAYAAGLLLSIALGASAAAWLARAMIAERTAELSGKNRELDAANRELEAFSYSISHDLRAPLRAISGFSAIVEREHAAALPPEGRRHLRIVRESAARMAKMVEDLLAFSRFSRQPLDRKPVDTRKLVERCVGLVRQDFGSRVECRIGELAASYGDHDLLMQVWLNLIGNAFKYTRDAAEPLVEIGSERREGRDVFFVRDNGVGFDMTKAVRLFEVFHRLHRQEEFEGTGAGLAIVDRIVARHGGRVWADAKPGGGATFYFTLSA